MIRSAAIKAIILGGLLALIVRIGYSPVNSLRYSPELPVWNRCVAWTADIMIDLGEQIGLMPEGSLQQSIWTQESYEKKLKQKAEE